ncbi:MAG TPA: peptide ABC transporter substrate-binding protein [Fluviicola sp.]|nr:peptide ABC transporter substrate-binding protein [Fluviicola sp.]
MNKLFLRLATTASFAILLTLLNACGEHKKQFEFAGGTFATCIDNEPNSFIARNVTDIYSFQMISQIMEGLVSFNPDDLSLQPQLAKSWKVSDEGDVFTFTIRDDVYFHNHEMFSSESDRLMTMEDVLYSFEKSCKPNEEGNPSEAYLNLFQNQLKGAKEFFEGKSKSISGIKINGNTIEFTLINPDFNYVDKLANLNASIVSKKVDGSNADNKLVGTGPFYYDRLVNKEEGNYILLKIQDYYFFDNKGNALPYLDTVLFYVQPRKLEQLEMFEQGQIQLISELPTSRITEMLESHMVDFNSQPPLMILYNNPLLITQYYFFNMQDERFKDVRVRKAFNYAIDRERLANNVLRNQFYEYGIYGITPPINSIFKGYDFSEIKKNGYQFNPTLAKKLLAEAGYPNGKGFGNVDLRLDVRDLNTAVADEFAQQIAEILGINVNIDGSDFVQRVADEKLGKGDMFRAAWIADYASPETYLNNFYGKLVPTDPKDPSPLNISRYNNPQFDTYLEDARKSSRKDKNKLLLKAEIELMQNPPIIPLWYANNYIISYSKVRNLKNNPMQFLDLKQVYIKSWTKEEYLKTLK